MAVTQRLARTAMVNLWDTEMAGLAYTYNEGQTVYQVVGVSPNGQRLAFNTGGNLLAIDRSSNTVQIIENSIATSPLPVQRGQPAF